MPEPQVTENINGYRLEWPLENLVINVGRLRTHSDGRITGDIQLILGKDSHVEPTFGWNFSSSQTRKQLINSLNEKYPEWRWLEIVDSLCRAVQERALAGEPIEELWSSEDIRAPEFLLEPILLKNLPTIVFGEKGVAKSTLSLVIYICLTLPWVDNPLGFVVPDRSVKTVIFDWEAPSKIAQWNFKKLVQGLGLPPLALYHRRCHLPLADELEQIQRYLAPLNAEVVIIDSLGRACGGELLRDTDNINRFFIGLEKLKVTPLILGQTSKDPDTKKRNIYGSVFFTYYARSIFELCKSETLNENELNIALFHRWSNLSKLYQPLGFRFSYNESKTYVERESVSYSEFKDKVSGQASLLNFLKDGKKSIKDIADELGWKEPSVRVLLSRLKKKDKVTNIDGEWGLLSSDN